MEALFIGRFQPFHKGHLKVIKNILKKYDKVVIGIGSSQYKNTSDNPFNISERKEMIKRSLHEENIDNYETIEIPDIHNPPKWVDHVLSIYSDFDIVITNNSFTKKLFKEKNIKVDNTPIFDKEIFSGRKIRNRIKNNEKWDYCVPYEVYKYIIKINGVERIKKILD